MIGLSLWGLCDENPHTMREAVRLWLFVSVGAILWTSSHVLLAWRSVNPVLSAGLSLIPLAGLITLLILMRRSLHAALEACAMQSARLRRPLSPGRALY